MLPSQALSIRGTDLFLMDEFFGDTISSYRLGEDRHLRLVAQVTAPSQPGDIYPTVPLGMVVNPVAPFVYAGESFVNRVAVWKLGADGSLTFVRSVSNSGQAVCWFLITHGGRRMYAVNTGDNSISMYDLADPANPVEVSRTVLLRAAGGTFQFAISPDERFIYALDEENLPGAAGKSNQIHILRVEARDGSLHEIAKSPYKLPVPAGNRPEGIVVF